MKQVDKNIFVDIRGYPGLQINLNQQVKRLAKTVNSKNGSRSFRKEVMLKPYSNWGYLSIHANVGENKRKTAFVHRLMALAFIPNPESKNEVNHKDGNKLNNDISNLEWCTHGENSKHAWDTGLKNKKVGENSKMWGLFKGEKSPLFGQRGEKSHKSKIILDTQTGIFYFGLRAAAEAKGYKSLSGLYQRLNGAQKNKTSLIYT